MALSARIWLITGPSGPATPRMLARPPSEGLSGSWLSPSHSKWRRAHRTPGDCDGHHVHIYQWMAPGGHHRGVQSKPNAAVMLYRHLRLTFFMNYLIETKETFSAPTSATNKTVPLKWIKKNGHPWKSTTTKMEARQKKKNKQTEKTSRHTVFEQTSWDIFWKQIFKKGLRQEEK